MRVAEYFRQPDGLKMILEVCKWWLPQAEREFKLEFPEQELELDFEIIFVEFKQSLHWHVICRTVQTLDNLRWLYVRGSYSVLLNSVFNRVCRCENTEPLELSVEWTAEDFENAEGFSIIQVACRSARRLNGSSVSIANFPESTDITVSSTVFSWSA
jgi:hypothetical protein